MKATSERIMGRSISNIWITSSSFSTAIDVRTRNEKINVVNVVTFGWIYVHNSVRFWGLLIYNYIFNEIKFSAVQVRKS